MKAKGFTLIELVIVVAIIVILGAMAQSVKKTNHPDQPQQENCK